MFAFRALERRLAQDLDAAQQALRWGFERHARRPNPADAALLRAVRSCWEGTPRDLPPLLRPLAGEGRKRLPARWVGAFERLG